MSLGGNGGRPGRGTVFVWLKEGEGERGREEVKGMRVCKFDQMGMNRVGGGDEGGKGRPKRRKGGEGREGGIFQIQCVN